MNLKRQLNWAAYIIFTLFIIVTVFTHIYVMHRQIQTVISNHNTQLSQLHRSNKSTENIYDTLAQTYQYERFSVTVSGQESFLHVSEFAIEWPLIATLLKPTSLLTAQEFSVGDTRFKFWLDTSDIVSKTQQLLIYLILGASSLYLLYSLLISMVIRRHVAQPLKQIGDAISRMSEFHFGGSEPSDMIDEIIPVGRALQKTRMELEAKYKKLTSQNHLLEQEAFNDQLTGLGNRVRFNKDFTLLLDSEQKTIHTGLLCFVRTTQLNTINKEHGFKAGDEYISKIAEHLRQSVSRIQTAKIYRINGADFAVLLPNQTESTVSLFAEEFKSLLNDYQKILDVDSIAYVGLINYRTGDKMGETLSSVDTAVSIAQTAQANGWYLHKATEKHGSQKWKETLEEVLDNTKVILLYQPIVPTNGEKPLYLDLLARFYDNDDKQLPTQTLIAMAKRHSRATDIDKLVVLNIIQAIDKGRLKGQHVGVKLTTSSVLSCDFLIWLERHLMSNITVSQQMIFEISCNTVEQNYENSKRLIAVLHKCGSKISMANFGISPLSFKQLKILKPDFVKLDSSLTKDIMTSKDDQFYVKQLVDVTHQLRTKVVIVGIESEEERFFIEGLRVDGMQGYFISEPANISELRTSVYQPNQ